MLLAPVAHATSLDEQIRELNSQAASQQQRAAQYHAEADTLANKLAGINAEVSQIRTQLALNRAKSQKAREDIEKANKELVQKKEILNENVRAIYQQSQVSPLEMLASSRDFSEFVDKQQYLDTIKDHVQEAAKSIQKLKAELEKQRAEVDNLISQQEGLAVQSQAKQAEAAGLLASTQGIESNYSAQAKANSEKAAQLKAQQAAILQAASRGYSGSIPGASNGSGGACDNGNGNGGYPMSWCDAPQDYYTTPWGYSRECVSWAGWRRSQLYQQGRVDRPVSGWGNANQWDDGARAAGYQVDGNPEVGAVAQTDAGFYGHVAVVEAVQGATVIVSEMNYDNAGHFRYSVYSTSYFKYIH